MAQLRPDRNRMNQLVNRVNSSDAEKLRKMHKRNGKPGANPSTDVHDLVNSIKHQ